MNLGVWGGCHCSTHYRKLPALLAPGPCRHLLPLLGQDHFPPGHLFLEQLPAYLIEASSPELEGK